MAKSYLEYLGKIKAFLLDCLFPNPIFSDGLPIHKTLFCGICRSRLPENKKICHKNAKFILGAATQYDLIDVRRTIWRLKYRGRSGLAQPLANILIRYAEKCGLNTRGCVVIPVPLSKQRLRQRGFNQSGLMAKFFVDHFGLSMNDTALIRIKNNSPQAELPDWDLRKENIKDAFAVIEPEMVAGKNIILIDDVTTSGATLSEAAGALKSAGVKKIIGLVVAKAG